MRTLEETITDFNSERNWYLVKSWTDRDTVQLVNAVALSGPLTMREAQELLKKNYTNSSAEYKVMYDYDNPKGFVEIGFTRTGTVTTFFEIRNLVWCRNFRWVGKDGKLRKLTGI